MSENRDNFDHLADSIVDGPWFNSEWFLKNPKGLRTSVAHSLRSAHSDHLAAAAQLRERVKELEAMLSTSLEQFESRMGDWENAEFHAWFNEAKKLVPPNWK